MEDAGPVCIVLGTRPEVLKNQPIVRALQRRSLPFVVLHTNQHHSAAMHENVFRDMGYAPDDVLAEYSLGRAIDWVQRRIELQIKDLRSSDSKPEEVKSRKQEIATICVRILEFHAKIDSFANVGSRGGVESVR